MKSPFRDSRNPPASAALGFSIIILVVAAAQLPAQDDPCLNRAVLVNVSTEDGQLVKGLTTANFQAKMQGRRGESVEITSVNYQAGFHRIVVLLDTSGSMRGASEHDPRWSIAMMALRSFLASAGPQSSIAFYTFNDRVKVAVTFAESRKSLPAEILKLENGYRLLGKTAVFDAILMAAGLFQPPLTGDAIFLVTDGADNKSRSSQKEVYEALQRSGVRAFAFGLLEPIQVRGRTPEEAGGPDFLSKVVRDSGGDGFAFTEENLRLFSLLPDYRLTLEPGSRLFSAAMELLAKEMSEFYILHIKLPQRIDHARDWKLELLEGGPKTNLPLRIIYAHKLAACD